MIKHNIKSIQFGTELKIDWVQRECEVYGWMGWMSLLVPCFTGESITI